MSNWSLSNCGFMAILCLSSAAIHRLPLICSLLLFLSCCVRNTVPVYGAGEAREGFRTTTVSSLLPKDKCSRPAGGGSRGLPITPRYGPCSKTGRPQPPNSQEISGLETSFFTFRKPLVNQQGGASKQLFEDNGNFLVQVGFGTPRVNFSLLLDTGSSETWVQCASCVHCLKGASNFTPAASATYSSGSCIPNGEENYKISYADYSSSEGNYGCDTLTMDPPDAFPKFQFGCGIENNGDFGKGVDGLLGLGPGPLSFLSQTASKYKKIFSHCLPSKHSIGSLLFGDNALSQSSSLNFTPLINPDSSGHYMVNLLGISVANKRLNIPSSVFSHPGTIVDSGTPVTHLPLAAYSALKAAFKEAMSNYTPSNQKPEDGLDICYDLSGNDRVTLPDIALHFGGGTDLVLNEKSILWGKNPSNVCLAFSESTGDFSKSTTIGSTQLLSRTVLYDIPQARIGFANAGCA